jgi:hypothetical protein
VIDCDAFDALHASSLAGPLDAARQADFDAHLEACPSCLERLRGYVTIREVLRRIAPHDLPETDTLPLPERLVSRIVTSLAASREQGDSQRRQG